MLQTEDKDGRGGAAERPQQLKALTTFAEGLGSIRSAHMVPYNHLWFHFQGTQLCLLTSMSHGTYMYTEEYIHIHIKRNKRNRG